MKNQALLFFTIQARDEWCYRSCQQKFQEYSKKGGHLKRLLWDVIIHPSHILHYKHNFNRIYPILFGIWNENGDAFGSENPVVESIDRFWARRGRVSQNEI